MIKLKDLLKTSDGIRILVEKNEYTEFLEWAKVNECLWDNGTVINPYKSDYRSNIIAVTKDLLIHHPAGWISNMGWHGKPGYRFSDIKNDIISDVRIEQLLKIKRQNEIDETMEEARKRLFKERCKQNRIISNLQLKYKYITEKLPKQFYVRYSDKEELLSLVLLLQKYGYENVYNIDFSLCDEKPYVICVDNKSLIYFPTNLPCCTYALAIGIKFHKYKDFEKMIERIFSENNENNV